MASIFIFIIKKKKKMCDIIAFNNIFIQKSTLFLNPNNNNNVQHTHREFNTDWNI